MSDLFTRNFLLRLTLLLRLAMSSLPLHSVRYSIVRVLVSYGVYRFPFVIRLSLNGLRQIRYDYQQIGALIARAYVENFTDQTTQRFCLLSTRVF
jgi:hypothetical protein